MPMPQRVQYSDAIEPLVQFIEDTPPVEILDRTLDKLRAGVPTETMLTASALAVTRSTEMPPGHHGGPLHPLAGLYAISKTVERLEGEERFVPVLQHVALTNKHINHPAMGPYALFEFAPEDAGGVEATKAALPDGGGSRRVEQGRPPLPVAVGSCAAHRGLRSLAERGDPEEFPRRPLLHVPRHGVARLRRGGSRQGVLQNRDAAGGALCDPFSGRPEQSDALAAAADRGADRGASAVEAHLPPAQRRG